MIDNKSNKSFFFCEIEVKFVDIVEGHLMPVSSENYKIRT